MRVPYACEQEGVSARGAGDQRAPGAKGEVLQAAGAPAERCVQVMRTVSGEAESSPAGATLSGQCRIMQPRR